MAIHNALGPGYKEEVYERALGVELAKLGISAQNQVPIARELHARGLIRWIGNAPDVDDAALDVDRPTKRQTPHDLLAELDELNLMMIEQPLAHDDLVRHAQLQKSLRTAICLDESIHSLADAAAARAEADRIGLRYMARAGYDPETAVQFWQRFAAFNSAIADGETHTFSL